MFRSLKLALVGMTLGTGLLASAYGADAPDSAAQAVTCGKCEVTWVKIPEKNQKGRVIGYTWGKKDVCTDCMDAVTSFFNTGKFEHTCKACGGSMEICESHPKK